VRGFQGEPQALLAVAQLGLAVALEAIAVQDGQESQDDLLILILSGFGLCELGDIWRCESPLEPIMVAFPLRMK
jgi:hypothetical protein